jgi:dolichol-phosphate mannosyltransferase
MPRVSLILPMIPGDPCPTETAIAYRQALESDGHAVEVLIVTGPGMEPPVIDPQLGRGVISTHHGLASYAMGGLHVAEGEFLVVVDPRAGYSARDIVRVVAPLASKSAEMVVASRTLEAGRIGRVIGQIARPFTGSTDPLSSCVGVTSTALFASFHTFRAVGSKFSLEILSKVEGRRIDIGVSTANGTRQDRPGWDDLRHLKRLADHRWGNASRLLQFCFVGASGAVVDLFCYWLFQIVFNATPLIHFVVRPTQVRWSLALAGSLSILVALLWNFTLNRRLTFSYARGGSLPRQCLAYIASNLPGVMVSLAIRLLLPRKVSFFNEHKLAAAVVGIVVATGLSFSMSRWVVFRRNHADDEREAAESPSRDSLQKVTVL